jgi:hypothetical protein
VKLQILGWMWAVACSVAIGSYTMLAASHIGHAALIAAAAVTMAVYTAAAAVTMAVYAAVANKPAYLRASSGRGQHSVDA